MTAKLRKRSADTVAKPSTNGGERTAPVREFVLNTVRNEILTGELVPGQRLVEGDMCQRLGVSRTSVREVLRQLEAEKLVAIEPYKGPSVARVSWEDAEEIYGVRELLEVQAVRLFARKVSAQEIDAMQAALERFRVAVTETYERKELVDSTTAFYDVILDGCGNRLLAELLRGLIARINLLRSRSMSLSERPRQSLEEMGKILKALKKHDANAAEDAAIEHIRNAREFAREAILERG